MCTVSWLYDATGYQLFFNRDESRKRKIAHPPKIQPINDTQALFPTDADAGGTWIGVNQYGLTVAILNYYHAKKRIFSKSAGLISRGLLVKNLLELKNINAVRDVLNQQDLRKFRPFVLLALHWDQQIISAMWDGQGGSLLVDENVQPPLSSSGFESQKVIDGRIAQFKQTFSKKPITAGNLLNFHKSHHPESGAYSVCMHRPEAHVVSFSHISVNHQKATFAYTNGAPCKTAPMAPYYLPICE